MTAPMISPREPKFASLNPAEINAFFQENTITLYTTVGPEFEEFHARKKNLKHEIKKKINKKK